MIVALLGPTAVHWLACRIFSEFFLLTAKDSECVSKTKERKIINTFKVIFFRSIQPIINLKVLFRDDLDQNFNRRN